MVSGCASVNTKGAKIFVCASVAYSMVHVSLQTHASYTWSRHFPPFVRNGVLSRAQNYVLIILICTVVTTSMHTYNVHSISTHVQKTAYISTYESLAIPYQIVDMQIWDCVYNEPLPPRVIHIRSDYYV